MKAKWLPLSAVVALALSSAAASAVDFHGYARAGLQNSTQGGEVYCYGTGAKGHPVGRLADECDTYAELVLSQDVYNKAGSKFTVNTLVAYGTTEGIQDLQGDSWQGVGGDGPWGGQRLSMREVWAGYQTDAGYQIWAGKRFYQRKDIHILDMYYLNDSGYGAGIENISAGNLGSLSFAVIKWSNDNGGQTDDKTTRRNVYKLDARWNGIPVGFGTLDAAVIYGIPSISDKQKDTNFGVGGLFNDENETARTNNANSGVLITLDHASAVNTDNVSLMNHFVAQYGTNGFASVGTIYDSGNHSGDNYSPDIDVQGVRVIDWGTFDVGNFGLGYSLIWAHLNSDKEHEKGATSKTQPWVVTRSGWEYSAVVRPEYKWTDFTRTTLELGYSKMKTNSWVADDSKYKDPDLYKVTLAQQFTPGKGFWTRPAIRFYVSYLGGDMFANDWNHGYKSKNKDGNSYQITYGAQMEAWW